MTVSKTTVRVDHVGDGSTTVFAYDFRIDSSSDLGVYLDGVDQSSGYTVAGFGTETGGIVTFATAPAASVAIGLVRDVPEIQDTDYSAYDAFPEAVHERALDRIVMMVQEKSESSDRALTAPVGEEADLELPILSVRKTKVLGFDSVGNPVVTQSTVDEIDALVAKDREAGTLISSDYFTGDGVTTEYTLTGTPINTAALFVEVGGVIQLSSSYSVSGNTLTFATAPLDGSAIEARNMGYQSEGASVVWVDVPATAGSSGSAGDVAYDAGYFYVCVSANTWKRTAISTW